MLHLPEPPRRQPRICTRAGPGNCSQHHATYRLLLSNLSSTSCLSAFGNVYSTCSQHHATYRLLLSSLSSTPCLSAFGNLYLLALGIMLPTNCCCLVFNAMPQRFWERVLTCSQQHATHRLLLSSLSSTPCLSASGTLLTPSRLTPQLW